MLEDSERFVKLYPIISVLLIRLQKSIKNSLQHKISTFISQIIENLSKISLQKILNIYLFAILYGGEVECKLYHCVCIDLVIMERV